VFKVTVLVIGAVIFLAGCGFAIYQDIENDREAELEKESQTAISTLMFQYGGISGALSIRDLGNEPDRISDEIPFSGKVAKVIVRTTGSSESEFLIPDDRTFDDHPKDIEERQIEKVPVNMGDGRVIPGEIEVILYA
jgi:hypothetical protein